MIVRIKSKYKKEKNKRNRPKIEKVYQDGKI